MLVNGQPAEQDEGALLTQLSSINSSFPDYVSVKPQYIPPQDAIDSYTNASYYEQKKLYTKALKQFQEVEKTIPKNEPNNPLLPNIYSHIGAIQQSLGKHKDAIVSFQQQLSQSMKDKDNYQAEIAGKNLANAHKSNGTLGKYEKEMLGALNNSLQNNDQHKELEARLALGAINRVQGNHKSALEQYAIAYDLQQGPVDYEATRVEQHEYGVSDKKIGTDNIQQCVAVILHDPVTKMAALAHVDKFTDASSLAEVVKKFPEGTKLDAYLVGGRDRSDEHKSVSDDNIKRVVGELQKHTAIDIKSADIGDKGAPSGIVFDPQTGELKHAVPGKLDNTTPARKAVLSLPSEELLSLKSTPLNFAFDLTKSDEMKGPTFTDRDKETLVRKYLDTPKVVGANETWNANVMYDPLAKVVEKIKQENPEIVKSAMIGHIEHKLSQNPPISPKRKDALLKDVEKSLNNPNKTLLGVGQESDKKLYELTKPNSFQQLRTTIKTGLSSSLEAVKNVFNRKKTPKVQDIQSNITNLDTQSKANDLKHNLSKTQTIEGQFHVTGPDRTPPVQHNHHKVSKSMGK
jgi:tetratricopeptide (TPR) repeat protein